MGMQSKFHIIYSKCKRKHKANRVGYQNAKGIQSGFCEIPSKHKGSTKKIAAFHLAKYKDHKTKFLGLCTGKETGWKLFQGKNTNEVKNAEAAFRQHYFKITEKNILKSLKIIPKIS